MLGKGRTLSIGLFVELNTPASRCALTDNRHNASHYRRAHYGNFGMRPDVGELSAEGSATHTVITRAIRSPDNYRDVWHRGIGHGIDHF